jgi:anti-sigma B factor antagonist
MTTCLEIAERHIGSVTVVELSGRFIVDEGDRAFRSRIDSLIRSGRTQLIVDLRNVSYIDSGGVGVLVSKYVTARNKGGDLKLLCLSPRACRVLGIAGLLNVFEVFEREQDAIGSFKGSAIRSH